MTNYYDPYTNDDDLNKLRQQRLQELKKEAALSTETYGQLTPVSREQELVHMLTNTSRLVIHFSMPTFRRCNIMSEHLQKLAAMYPKTRFVEVRADEMPFLVAKFKIQVLPCLAVVILSQLVDKIVGFDELGGSDDFPTAILEKRLQISGAIGSPRKQTLHNDDSDDDI